MLAGPCRQQRRRTRLDTPPDLRDQLCDLTVLYDLEREFLFEEPSGGGLSFMASRAPATPSSGGGASRSERGGGHRRNSRASTIAIRWASLWGNWTASAGPTPPLQIPGRRQMLLHEGPAPRRGRRVRCGEGGLDGAFSHPWAPAAIRRWRMTVLSTISICECSLRRPTPLSSSADVTRRDRNRRSRRVAWQDFVPPSRRSCSCLRDHPHRRGRRRRFFPSS